MAEPRGGCELPIVREPRLDPCEVNLCRQVLQSLRTRRVHQGAATEARSRERWINLVGGTMMSVEQPAEPESLG